MLIYTRHDPRFFDRRLHKGGGDGGAGEMRAQEADRQQKVQAAVDAINGRFGVGNPAAQAQRQTMYDDISGAVRDTAMRDVDRQFTQASKQNVFGLARSGLLGGSVDAEAGGQLNTLYGEGRLKAAQSGVAAASDLRSTDEKARQNLISLAQSGLDTGTAASMAAGQMSAAAELAKSQAAGASVGRLFDNLGQGYLQNQMLKARYPGGLPQAANAAPYSSENFTKNFFGIPGR